MLAGIAEQSLAGPAKLQVLLAKITSRILHNICFYCDTHFSNGA